MTDRALGIDLGGTAVKLGLVDRSGAILAHATVPTPQAGAFEALADGIAAALHGFGAPALPLGLATPGHLHPATGIAVDGMINVPVLHGRSLPAALRARGFPDVRSMNDGVAAAIGEALFGAGRHRRRFALMTIGTGIGGAVVANGSALTGAHGEPPEFGAMVVGEDGLTLERGAGAAAFAAELAARGGPPGLTPAEVTRLAASGDPAAVASFDAVCRRVARAFGTMINLLALDCCLIGGGVAAAGEPLLRAVRRHLPDFTWPFLLEGAEIALAARGNDAGILGAAALALRAT